MSKSSITISPRFFATELQNYSCPRSAVVRELLQNCADSTGCTKIDFEFGTDWIGVKDNGKGMNRDTLINKFLTIGATGKEGDTETTGGFGKAKIILAFAQESYSILSHDYKLEGVGGDYEILDNPEFTRGCHFKIHTKETNWERHIKKVLSKCNLKQVVTINGEVHKSTISRGRWARSLSFGEVWVNKSQDRGIIVRVNGVFMFETYCDAPAQVIIEINPEISRDVLLSNRDSLVYQYQKELNQFVNELASESISALKTKTKKFTQLANPGKAILSKKKQTKPELDFNLVKFGQAVEQIAALMSSPKHDTDTIEVNTPVAAVDIKNPKWYDPAMISLESESLTLVKAAKFFDLSYIDESTTRIKLLKVWKTILEFVTEKYTERYSHEFAWGFGFVFSDDAAAQCKTYDNIHYLLLNPVGSDGKIKFSINNKEDLSSMIVFACHEIAHIHSSRHDESFAAALTYTMADTLKGISELFRKIKEEK